MTIETQTRPATDAGQALVEWAQNATPEQINIWRDHATLIEAEAIRMAVERTGIRLTSQQVRDALHVLGHTGTAAEAFVRSAAGAMADILDEAVPA